jgi:hypothetical protein
MPDFEKLLRQRLGSWSCPGREDVVQELAAHLEDRFQELLREGMAPDNAALAAFEIVEDWRELRTKIAAARRGTMTERARCILIPGAVALLIAVLAERLLWPMAATGRLSELAVVWVMLIAPNLFAGASGAAISLYAGGSRRHRIWAAGIPVLSALSLFMAFVWNISKYGFALQTMSAWSRNLLFIVLIPAGALFAGALPFLASGSKSHGEKIVEA